MDEAFGLLLVGHGSQLAVAQLEMNQLAAAVADRVDMPVRTGWLEHAKPEATTAAWEFAAQVDQILIQPLLFFEGEHSTVDIPKIADDASEAGAEVKVLGLLGRSTDTMDYAATLVQRAGPSDALVLAASGSSMKNVKSEVDGLAHLLAFSAGLKHRASIFARLEGSGARQALKEFANDGVRTVTLFSWSLFAGRLYESMVGEVAEAAERLDLTLLDAGRFGPSDAIADEIATNVSRA